MSPDVPERSRRAWLLDAQARLGALTRGTIDADDCYRLGDAYLGIRSTHNGFRRRFERLFGACREAPPEAAAAPLVRCAIHTLDPGDVSIVEFDDPEALDVVDFATALFGDRGCRELDSGSFRGRLFGLVGPESEVVLGAAGPTLLAHNDQAWEWLVGNLAVHRTLRLQPGVAVLHAGSVGVRGHGTLLIGPKGSGKTTLTLALAARGHSFLGDEMAVVRLQALELAPLRRTTSVRPGPASRRVESALRATRIEPEPFPDGSSRVRVQIGELFPDNSAASVPLKACLFLRGMAEKPRLEPFVATREHLGLLTPLRSSMWQLTAAQRAVRLLGILSKTKCYFLDVGSADATADLITGLVEETWG